ncbi:abortive infection family protein [Natranaerobius thermophilus]|uniref:abortive infection family protein n=1 Tax=Natranaerobius thermophilus TaxID=375929 RepID=UPI001930DCD8|nr:abortive infection family protein [Natranaerobius thermophilus]
MKIEYKNDIKIQDLYKLVAKELNLSPSQHNEELFKQILGGCSGVVSGLGSIRNAYGDAHGKGKKGYRPDSRLAEFAVNISGSMCLFLLQTHKKGNN